MNHWTVRKRITVGFALVLGLVVGQSAVIYLLTHEIRGEVDGIAAHTLPGTLLVGTIRKNVSDMQILMLRVLLAKTAEERTSFQAEISARSAANAKTLAAFEKTLNDPVERQRLEALTALRETYKASRSRIIALAAAGKQEEAIELNNSAGRPAYQTYDTALSELVEYNTNGIQTATTRLDQNAARVGTVTTAAGSGVLLLGAVAAYLLVSRLTRILVRLSTAVGEGSAQVAMAANQVSGSSQSLAEGASEQAASLEETSSSLEELSSMTKRNADSAISAKALSGETRAAAETGNTDMGEMRSAMDAIKTSSNDIAKIIKAIDEIAFQTNILALNAAVEAARAGEAGAGFAVVAEEVRALAQRSAHSAQETADKIEVAIRNGNHGAQISGKVAHSLGVIVEKARQVDTLIGEIAHASQEQNQGISQINIAVSQMDKVTQSNAAGAEETAAAAQQLSAQSFTLDETVGELQRLVGGGHATQAAAPAAPLPSVKENFNAPVRVITAAGFGRPKSSPVEPALHEDFFKEA